MNQAFLDILRGYSCAKYKSKTIFLKHLTCLEHCKIEEDGEEAFKRAILFGNKTRDQLLQKRREEGKWTDANDREINMQRALISSVEKGAEKMLDIPSLEDNESLLDEYRENLFQMESKKRLITQGCAEDIRDIAKEMQTIIVSSFWDEEMKNPILDDDCEPEELDPLRAVWRETFSKFNDFESICTNPYSVNVFSVFYDHPHEFFRKSAFEITDLQARFINTSKDVLFILRECGKEIPLEDRSNYKRLVLYWKLHLNLMRADNAEPAKEV